MRQTGKDDGKKTMNETAKKEFLDKFKPKLMAIAAANVVIWGICSTAVWKMPMVFPMMFSAFTIPFLVYFALNDRNLTTGKSLSEKIIRVLITYFLASGGVLALVIWLVAAHYGFPRMFTLTIIVFAWLALALFLLIEHKPPMREPTGLRAFNNLVVVYLGASLLYYGVSAALPQYDPKYEIENLAAKGLSLAGLSKEQIIEAGKKVFKDFECANCHNIASGGEVKRGPVLSEVDMGDSAHILESMVDPYKDIKKPYADNPKVARSMPDYFGKQMSKDELSALVLFLESLKGKAASSVPTDKMPDGWWINEEVAAKGKQIFEGLANPDVACHVCHGKDGTPQFEGAVDFRTNKVDSLTSGRWFQIVKYGFKADSTMGGWGDYLSDEQIWQVIAYENTFRHGGKPAERPEPAGPNIRDVVKEKYW